MKKKTEKEEGFISSVFLDPLTDFGFKKIFLDKDLLSAFLSDVAGIHIRDIQYQSTEGLGESVEERKVIFDLYCTTDTGEHVIVEMQVGKQNQFTDRALFYASHAIRKQAPRKKYWNYELKAVYVVSILDFIIFKEEEAKSIVVERASLYREQAKKHYSGKLSLVFIELPKFTKTVKELGTNTDRWLYLLRHLSELEDYPPEITGKVFKKFLETAQIKNLTPTEMETYSKSLSKNFYVRNIAECARMEGREEGDTKGRMEERKLIAVKLIERKTPVEEIMFLTNLTKEQIQELAKENS
ncbi:hypothetical protein FACS1894181_09320 [Bacteroidia bacterium]|nr:hypothetical protein FACS1894181_09320 [Bacteroidia bacterium]